MNNIEFCEQIKINDIPWSRIVGCYNRATNFPNLILKLNSKNKTEREKALKEISLNIEHQSTLYTVTPITLIFIFKTLNSLEFKEVNNISFIDSILDLILLILEIVKDNFDYFEIKNLKIENLKGILSEEYLWNEFESEDQDEINWEENIMTEDYYYSLNINIIDVMKFNYYVIKSISSYYIEKTSKIIDLINTFE